MLCIGSWLKKTTLEEEKLSLKSRVDAAFYIVDFHFDILFVNAHCFVAFMFCYTICDISWHSKMYTF